MPGIDQGMLNEALIRWQEPEPVMILEPGPQTRTLIPASWWPVAEAVDPDERKRVALGLWNAEFLDLIPEFARALSTELVDVRVVRHSWMTAPSLDYVLFRDGVGYAVWAGENPATFGEQDPPLFEALPSPAQRFLREVHAGFTIWDGEACGLAAPARMETLAAHWGHPEGVPDWDFEWEEDCSLPDSTRLLMITTRGSSQHLLVSPDVGSGVAVTYFEPEFEIRPFGEALDIFMTTPLMS